MKNTAYRTHHLQYLQEHYATQPATHFAQKWGTTPSKVYHLARRHGITKRAPNGQPVWRQAA